MPLTKQFHLSIPEGQNNSQSLLEVKIKKEKFCNLNIPETFMVVKSFFKIWLEHSGRLKYNLGFGPCVFKGNISMEEYWELDNELILNDLYEYIIKVYICATKF